jgi:hypothetical protein
VDLQMLPREPVHRIASQEISLDDWPEPGGDLGREQHAARI